MMLEFISVFKDTPPAPSLPPRIRVKGATHDYTESVKNVEEYRNLLYRAKLTVELHNRENPTDLWEVQEEREKVEVMEVIK